MSRSGDIDAKLVLDSRLRVSDKINWAIEKGAMNSNWQTYPAQSATTSNLIWNIQTPSLSSLVDRRLIMRNQFVLKLSGTPANGQLLIDYGKGDSLAAFPVHRALTTMSCVLNNNAFQINQADVCAMLMRFIDTRDAVKVNSQTPFGQDMYWGQMSQGVNTISSSQTSLNNANHDNTYLPNGAYRLLGASNASAAAVQEGIFDAVPVGAAVPAVLNYWVLCESFEPLMCSPFQFNSRASDCAMYGIQTMNFNFTVGQVNRSWRHSVDTSVAPDFTLTATLEGFKKSELQINYLTGHASLNLPPQNVLYYNDISRYQTPITENILAATRANNHLTPTKGWTVQSNTLTLNTIADKYILAVRKRLSLQTPNEPDRYFPISKVRVTFDNRSGLLSTVQKDELFYISNKNGANFSYLEAYGCANSHVALNAYPGYDVATCGSFFVFSPVYDMCLNEEYYSASSLAQIQVQFEVEFENWYEEAFNNQLELVFVTMDSGVMINQLSGSTSKFLGILNKNDVLAASEKGEVYYEDDVERLVGGRSILDRAKGVMGSVLNKISPVLKSGRAILEKVNDPRAKVGAEALKAMGYGMSGGKKKVDQYLM